MTLHRVRSLMATDGPRLAPDTPIRQAVARLAQTGSAAALVIDDAGRLAGLLTQKDCFRPALHASYYQEWRGSVADYMTRAVHTIDAQDDIIHAAERFLDLPHRVLPVMEGGAPAGLLDRARVLSHLSALG